MRFLSIAFCLVVTAFWTTAASADHMTGRYQGTGNVTGVIIDLTQTGTTLKGVISGTDSGTLEGTSDGGNGAQGTIRLDNANSKPFQFQAQWSQQGLAMKLLFPGQPADVFFEPASSAQPQPPGPGPTPPPGPGPNPTPPPLPGATDVQYFVAVNNQPVGPLTLNDMIARIQQKSLAPKDLVWKTGAPGWAPAESYPELAAAFNAPSGPPPLPPETGPEPQPPGGQGGGLTPPSN